MSEAAKAFTKVEASQTIAKEILNIGLEREV